MMAHPGFPRTFAELTTVLNTGPIPRLGFMFTLMHALLAMQARNWRLKVRPAFRAALMLIALSQVWLIADIFSALPNGTMATAFAYPFDDWNLWLLYTGALFGSAAVWYTTIAAALMQSLHQSEPPNKSYMDSPRK